MRKFLFTMFIVLVGWFIYWHFGYGEGMEPGDINILLFIAIGSFFACFVMLLGTDEWKARDIGIFCFFLATAMLYGLPFAENYGIHLFQHLGYQKLVRVLFLVGTTLIVYGGVEYLIYNWGNLNPFRRTSVKREVFLLSKAKNNATSTE